MSNDRERHEVPELNHEVILDNLAVLTDMPDPVAQRCDDGLVFIMEDEGGRFLLDLKTVLRCLSLAESAGHVAPLPGRLSESWWLLVERKHDHLFLSNYANSDESPRGQDGTPRRDHEHRLLFALEDKQRRFSLGVDTVLQCLRIAEDRGQVPKLPDEWWTETADGYTIDHESKS